MTDRLEWTLKSLGRVKGDRLLLRDDGHPYAVKQMRALIAQAQVEAGLQETGNMHILRHTFCTRLAMKGVPPITIQKLAGHVHLSTTLRYMHVVKGAEEAAIAELDAPPPRDVVVDSKVKETAAKFGRIVAEPWYGRLARGWSSGSARSRSPPSDASVFAPSWSDPAVARASSGSRRRREETPTNSLIVGVLLATGLAGFVFAAHGEDRPGIAALSSRPGKPVIARVWHGKTPRAKADEYETYISSAITKFESIGGNLGYQLMRIDGGPDGDA